jgi:hypothetical protein
MANIATSPIPFLGSACADDPPSVSIADDVIWGANGLATELGVSERRAFYLLERAEVPAKKVGGKWCVLRSALRNHLRAV